MPELGGPHREPIAIFVVGTVVGAVVIGLIWLAVSGSHFGQGHDPAAPAIGSTGSPTPGSADRADRASAQQVAEARAQSCAAVYVAQGAPLQAADASMSQWEVHVGAMNKLVTGAITLHQANQFWNSTRVGAKAKLRHFRQAMARYDQRTHRCPQRWAASGGKDVRRCRAAVATRNHALRLADVALTTWKRHVIEMEMLRMGKMSPSQAERMWIRSWTRGNHQVHAYTRAAKAAEHLSC